jgi:hypothetical protein
MGRQTLVGVCLLLSTLLARDAWPCAPAPPEGASVYIAGEEAIILWDPATKTETFIRRAAFQSTAASFGFLVPTPTVPQLGEVDKGVFDGLDQRIAPETKYDTSGYNVDFKPLLTACLMLTAKGRDAAPMAVSQGVHIIQTARVAGFDATTIAADNADAMASWLADHGFAKSPELTEWLARYVDTHWTITAFVIANDDKAAHSIATSAVRMTFTTERPFYPYREPKVKETRNEYAPSSRKLRMHFISDARYAATLVNAPWSAPIAWAAPLPNLPNDLVQFAGAHKFATVFDDDSFPRKGIDEVYFARDTEQSEIKPPPFIIKEPTEIWIPLDGVIILGIIVIVIVRKIRKYRRSKVGRL